MDLAIIDENMTVIPYSRDMLKFEFFISFFFQKFLKHYMVILVGMLV